MAWTEYTRETGATPLPTGAATSDNQTNGLQLIQIVDAGGEAVTVTGGKLDVNSSAPVGGATYAAQTDGTQLTRIVDVHGHQTNVQLISASVDGSEYGIISNAIIHGKSTAGGGAWVDVKVNPSGALTVESTVTSSALPSGAATSANQTLQLIDSGVLNTLVLTLNELNSRLTALSATKQELNQSLRVTALTGSTTAVTGSLTSAGTVTTVGAITNFGTGAPANILHWSMQNNTAIVSNINNCVGS